MSFRNTLDDIKNVTPAELGGVATTDLPPNTESRAVHVSNTGGSILFDLVAATADEGGGVTASATAPASPSENDLWYDTDGSGGEGPSQLYIYTTVEGSNMDWVAVTPTAALPNLPPMSAAGSYSLTVDDSSNLSWTAGGSGGGGGGGGGVGTYSGVFDGTMSDATDNQLVMQAGKSYRLRIDMSAANIWWGVESGFDNFAGGWYKAREREWRVVDSPDAADQVWEVDAVFMGSETGFRTRYRASPFFTTFSSGTWSGNQGAATGGHFAGTSAAPDVMRQGGFFEGEFQIGPDGDVVWAVFSSVTDTTRESSNSRTQGTNVFLAEIT